jgi:hypothetical protein
VVDIENPVLFIDSRLDADEVYLRAACDVKFTDFEVNAMNTLGLQYRLNCRLFNKDLWDTEEVAILDDQLIARRPDAPAPHSEHAVFETTRPREDLHTHVFTPDKLVAELYLINEETGDEVRVDTVPSIVDLT